VVGVVVAAQMGRLDPQAGVEHLLQFHRQRVAPLRARLGLDAAELPQAPQPGFDKNREGFVRAAR
jgi:hypothetical protein